MDADEKLKMHNIMFALNKWIVGKPFAGKGGKLNRKWANFWGNWYSPSEKPNRYVKQIVLPGGRTEPAYQVEDSNYSPFNHRKKDYRRVSWPIVALTEKRVPLPSWFYLLDHPSWGKVLVVTVLIDEDEIEPRRTDTPFMVWFYEDGDNKKFVQVWSEEDFQRSMLDDEDGREWLMEGKLYMITDFKATWFDSPTILNWNQFPESFLETDE